MVRITKVYESTNYEWFSSIIVYENQRKYFQQTFSILHLQIQLTYIRINLIIHQRFF